eukprot:c4213_g1_i2.p1 GENE.c4213_g1_i2~~c4213_g1_i2.p1  ORF type:complete len:119 (-),score=22.12 c4213_g1_i2:40-357(-)
MIEFIVNKNKQMNIEQEARKQQKKNNFPEPISKNQIKKCLLNFYNNTNNRSLSEVTCSICGDAAQVILLSKIKNLNLLKSNINACQDTFIKDSACEGDIYFLICL